MDTAQLENLHVVGSIEVYGERILGRKLNSKNVLKDANPRTREHLEKMDTTRMKKLELQSTRKTERSKEGYQYDEVIQELGKVKHELRRLKLDMASAAEAKANSEMEAEASGSRAMCILQLMDELRKQIDESDEEHVLVELARIEAEREHREVETQRVAEAAEFAKRIEAAKKTIKDLNEEISHCEELNMELNITNSAINVLQTELESVRAKGKKETSTKRKEQRSWHSSLLEDAKAELLAAKEELASVKEEGFQFMNSMDCIRQELVHIAEETSQLKKLEKKAESRVVELNSQLLKAKTKLEAMTVADERTRTIASNISAAIQQIHTETEAVEKETGLNREETSSIKSQIEKTDLEISSGENKLQSVVQVLHAAKAAEAMAFKKLKNVTKRAMSSKVSLIPFSSNITISKSEYGYLIRNAATAQVVADKKVAAAQAWIEALMDREKKVLMKAELIEKEIREFRAEEVRELHETQKSVFARKSLEEELNKMMKQNVEEEDIDEQNEEEDEDSGNMQLVEEKPRKSIRGEGMLPRSRSIKIRRIPSSPATRHVRSPLIVIKKRRN